MKRLIFGTGVVCRAFMRAYNIKPDDIAGFIESHKVGDSYEGRPLYSVHELGGVEYDEICVASARYNMVEELLEQGVHKNKIVLCHIKLLMEYLNRNGNLDIRIKLPSILTNKLLLENIIDEQPSRLGEDEAIIARDYCRTGTLQLISREINHTGIKGSVAELGVYQGDFSRYINALFPDRTLYLFDTFEGFDVKEQENNIAEKYSSVQDIKNSDFSDTSIQRVVSNLPYPQNAVVKKGKFPDTVPQEDIKYAFVSIDCDLYDPIYAGLDYFYPQLNEGGYIMIHDYNMEKFMKGIHQAVERYEAKTGRRLHRVPIPDECGSLVISK